MKKEILALFSLAALAMAQTASQPATSAPTVTAATGHVPNKVGVIQIQGALVSNKDGQKAVQEFQAKLEPKKKDLDKKAADIRDLQDRLQRGGPAMAQAAKDDLARQIDVKTKSYNRDMEDAQAEADSEQRKMLDELGQKMMQVIDKYAQANNYAVIIDVSNPQTPVLYASNTVDITKDIIEMYDKTASTLTSAPARPATPAATKPGAPAPAATKPITPAPVKKQP